MRIESEVQTIRNITEIKEFTTHERMVQIEHQVEKSQTRSQDHMPRLEELLMFKFGEMKTNLEKFMTNSIESKSPLTG